MRYIGVLELKSKIDSNENPFILDIREAFELDICKIDSVHIPMDEVGNRANELPKTEPIIILCRSGKRAVTVANLLENEFNMGNTFILEGGILDWIEKVDNKLEAY
jgi:rhodanese-related sulfurtransferase